MPESEDRDARTPLWYSVSQRTHDQLDGMALLFGWRAEEVIEVAIEYLASTTTYENFIDQLRPRRKPMIQPAASDGD